MKAMVLNAPGRPLDEELRLDPMPAPGELRIRVEACAICRTDVHVVDGELPDLRCPRVPGHEVVGRVDLVGAGVAPGLIGRRVGLGWLGHTCGHCPYCRALRENLCDTPEFTGYTRDGGFATHVVADAAYVFPVLSHKLASCALGHTRSADQLTRELRRQTSTLPRPGGGGGG